MKKILTEWRGFISEASEESKQEKFPESVFYGIPMSHLDTVRDSGVINMPSGKDVQDDKIGVPTCASPDDAFAYGDVVLEISGQFLNESGEYVCSPNSKGSRVSMKDSSYSSGSGIDSMVDQLGTNIPFTAVKSIIFSRKPDVEKLKNNGYGSMGISMVPQDGSTELQNLYTPDEEE